MPHNVKGCCYEGSTCSLMARVYGRDGVAIVQADITSATLHIFDTSDDSTVVSASALTVANVVFDTLQTDARWTEDATGYNFRYDTVITDMPDGNKTYQAEVIFVPATGGASYSFPATWSVETTNLRSS